MKKLNILIIPSWYPNEKDPLWGNYFIKQASALSEYANVSMLYVNRIGLKEINKLSKERITDGYDNKTYPFIFYKKTILNYKSVSLDYSFKKYAKNAYKAYDRLRLFIDKPDIIIAESILPAALAARYIGNKENIPYIVHAHSENVMSNPLYKKYINEIIKSANGYMAVNNGLIDVLNKKGRKDVILVPNFINTKEFDVKQKNNKEFTLISICNFYKVKALDVLLKALNIVINEKGYKDIKLKIVGTGEYGDYYKSIAHSLNLNSNVEFLGYVNNKDIPKIMSTANALCVSSTFETFCIPIIEAFSMGIPVISTKCIGPLEIVNNDNGILVSINDINEYADAIIKMKKDFKKYSKKKIKNYAYCNYDKSVVCKQILDICNNILGK